jgi:FlgN protein
VSTMLEAELLAHLDTQIASAKRLLATILEQGAAIRARDVDTVLAKLAEIQTEMGRRGRLEQERTRLLQGAGALLGLPAQHVTLERLCDLITAPGARAARERSSELRGVLGEIAREHGINRALMRQELAFLSHLVRLVGDEHEGGYQPGGAPAEPAAAAQLHQTLDLRA